MDNQVYLFLARDWGSMPDGAMATVMMLPKILLSLIQGDSLDVPYMRFIKIQSVSHNIGQSASGDDLPGAWQAFSGGHRAQTQQKDRLKTLKSTLSAARSDLVGHGLRQRFDKKISKWLFNHEDRNQVARVAEAEKNLAAGKSAAQRRGRYASNAFLNQGGIKSHFPEHGTLTFSKSVDGATPQLAYGCSAQELFKTAIFFYQRRTSFNISAVRFPYMVIGLENVMIREWQLTDDSETVQLSYDQVCWGAFSQAGDTPLPMPLSTRFWNPAASTGGQLKSKFGGFVAAFTGALFAAGAAPVAVTAGFSV